MLRKFVYLDKTALAEYTATLEGGLIAETKTRSVKLGAKGGRLGIKGYSEANIDSKGENERSQTLSDAPEAQFERLLNAANEDPETIGWIDVMEPDTDLAAAQVGEFISWECDAYIPDIARLLAIDGDAAKKIVILGPLLRAITEGGVKVGDEDIDNLNPEKRAELEKIKLLLPMADELLKSVKGKRSVVGEDEDTAWKVFGTLVGDYLRVEDIDDERLVIVGKIKRRLAEGRWQPIMGLLTLEMPSRAERRKKEKEAPPAGIEEQYISGPALELEILAIFR